MNNDFLSRLAVRMSALICVLMGATGFAASPTFTTQTYPILGNDHIAADFNGDGKLDLACGVR